MEEPIDDIYRKKHNWGEDLEPSDNDDDVEIISHYKGTQPTENVNKSRKVITSQSKPVLNQPGWPDLLTIKLVINKVEGVLTFKGCFEKALKAFVGVDEMRLKMLVRLALEQLMEDELVLRTRQRNKMGRQLMSAADALKSAHIDVRKVDLDSE